MGGGLTESKVVSGKPTPPPPGDTGEKSRIVVPLPELSAEEKQKVQEKDAAAQAAVANKAAGKTTKSGVAQTRALPVGTRERPERTTNNIYSVHQVTQETWYWCGPATFVSIAASYGTYISQEDAASTDWLGTTTDGTDWSNRDGSPMQNALNRVSNGFYYAVVQLPYSPTATDKARFKIRLVSNVDSGHAIAGNTVEIPSTSAPHLVGHPTYKKYYHWIAIEGYRDSGETAHYADSIAGASSISWSWRVPRYSYISSAKLTTIMGEHGYIW